MKKLKKIPKFKNASEEAKFWAENDATNYLDFSNAKASIFPNLKPTTKPISIRLPESLLHHLKTFLCC